MRVKDDKKHQAICDAAIELITTKGFADTSMSKIAKAADVSPATIYVYFENKEDLLNKIYLYVKEQTSRELLNGVKEEMSVKEYIKTVWYNFYKYAKKNPINFSFGEQFANSPLVDGISKEESLRYFQPMLDIFQRGKSEKVLKDIPLEIFAAFTFEPLKILLKQHFSEDFKLTKKHMETVFDIAWDAVTN
ncbi:MAG: TetR/AcrR family transcriptional regulator [Pyrinomonadaceae bacterium]|nr:TetR/AcrR family transcriptional regulator [Pyrinomonadaceae bacterium]